MAAVFFCVFISVEWELLFTEDLWLPDNFLCAVLRFCHFIVTMLKFRNSSLRSAAGLIQTAAAAQVSLTLTDHNRAQEPDLN